MPSPPISMAADVTNMKNTRLAGTSQAAALSKRARSTASTSLSGLRRLSSSLAYFRFGCFSMADPIRHDA